MAEDKSKENDEGKETKEKEEILTLDEGNEQNSAVALRYVCWDFCGYLCSSN